MLREVSGNNFSSQSAVRLFSFWIIISQVIGVTAVALLAYFLGHYRGGFAWTSDIAKEFNYHPLLMTLGLVFFYGDAILAYRVFRNVPKLSVKILHATLLLASLIFSSIGLKAVFDNHNLSPKPKPNLYSIHSWVGLTTVILFGLQWVAGFLMFLFPKTSDRIRANFMPTHRFFGKFIFVMAIASVLMGITEYCIFNQLYSDTQLVGQRNLINVYGLFIVTFAGLILYIVSHPGYQRPSDGDTAMKMFD